MKKVVYFITLVLFPLLFVQCEKLNLGPINQLPPITQEGKNTFGCLLNGKAWTPKGSDGTSNYVVYYDPTYRKGTLNISTYRYPNEDSNNFQTITIGSDSISTTGTYSLTIPNHQEAMFKDTESNCHFAQGQSHSRSSTLNITKLDKRQGIISGTFEFTLAKPGCETVKVTKGRFDKKL